MVLGLGDLSASTAQRDITTSVQRIVWMDVVMSLSAVETEAS
jgi:hypothetical protein